MAKQGYPDKFRFHHISTDEVLEVYPMILINASLKKHHTTQRAHIQHQKRVQTIW